MMVAMSAMRMMQMAGYQVIDMIAVRNGLMPAVGAVLVTGVVALAFVTRRAVLRVGRADRNAVLVIVVIMMVVQMPIVEVIDVIFVLNPGVPESRSVDVDVVTSGVHLVPHNVFLLPFVQTG